MLQVVVWTAGICAMSSEHANELISSILLRQRLGASGQILRHVVKAHVVWR